MKQDKKRNGYTIYVPSKIQKGYALVDEVVCSEQVAIEAADRGRELIRIIDEKRK